MSVRFSMTTELFLVSLQVWAVNKTIQNPLYKSKATKKTNEEAANKNEDRKEPGKEEA